MFDKPMGGTELMYEELMKRLPDIYKERFSIFNYISQADFSKTTIYWNQLSYDQEAVQWLSDPANVVKIDHFVFISHWQSECYRKMFNIPGYKTRVIKNACIGVERRISSSKEVVKLCYTSTPWRGLDVLLDAWELLNPPNCELHVFSSCQIYGKDFAHTEEAKYTDLYNRCLNTKGVVYRGSVPNEELRKELPSFDILAYPCTFEETSCIAIIEALSAGLRVVTSNLGALPETTEGWARIYPYLMDKNKHAEVFAGILKEEIEYIIRGKLDRILEIQADIYYRRWNWDERIYDWKYFLDGIIQDKSGLLFSNSWERQIFTDCYIYNEYNIQPFDSEDVVIDIGCHIGSFSRLVYDNGCRNIISFEANPDMYEKCRAGLPKEISVINRAVWRSDEPAQKLRFDNDIVDYNTGTGRVFEGGRIEVDSIALDDVLESHPCVKLLKMDAEGSEYSMLFTSKNLHRVHTIVGEFHEFPTTKNINGYSLDREGLRKYFVDLGWEIEIQPSEHSQSAGLFKAVNPHI
jgi:FkbM family methyltransferase